MIMTLTYKTSRPAVKNIFALYLGLRSLNNEKANNYASFLYDSFIRDNLNDCSQLEITKFLHGRKMLSCWSMADSDTRKRFLETELLYRAMTVITNVRIEKLIPVFTALKENEIDVMPYKGIDFIYNYPNASGTRFISDVDPLIKRSQLLKADAVIKALGFRQGDIDRNTALNQHELHITEIPKNELEWVINNHHETHPYVAFTRVNELKSYKTILEKYTKIYDSGEPILITYIDLHQSIAAGFDEDDIWAGTVISKIEEVEYIGLSPEVYLCLLFGRAYSVTQIYNDPTICAYVDGMRILVSKKINWEKLFSLSCKYNFHAPFYYCLSHANKMLGEDFVPTSQINIYRESLLSRREYDLGDFYPKLLGYI